MPGFFHLPLIKFLSDIKYALFSSKTVAAGFFKHYFIIIIHDLFDVHVYQIPVVFSKVKSNTLLKNQILPAYCNQFSRKLIFFFKIKLADFIKLILPGIYKMLYPVVNGDKL